MANWFVYDSQNIKRGPFTSAQLKAFADKGKINPNTAIETENGRKAKAGQVRGLFSTETVATSDDKTKPSSQSSPAKNITNNRHEKPNNTKRTWFYYDPVGTKCGPVDSVQLKKLAEAHVINEETDIENSTGRKVKASQIKGLFPLAPPQEFPQFNTYSDPSPFDLPPVPPSFSTFSGTSESTGIPEGSMIDQFSDGDVRSDTSGVNGFTSYPADEFSSSYSNDPFSFSNSNSYPVETTNVSESVAQTFCTNCGSVVSPWAVACLRCGANPEEQRKYCRRCGTKLNRAQVVCLRCGAAVDSSSGGRERSGHRSRRSSTGNSGSKKSKTLAAILALFLGGPIGIHKFYLGKTGMGLLYLLLALLSMGFLLPLTAILALIDGIVLLCMNEDVFEDLYCNDDYSGRQKTHEEIRHKSAKNRLTAALLAFFGTGFLGIHKFYLGRPGMGILYIILTILTMGIVSGILCLIDFVVLICMDDDTFGAKYNPDW